MRRLKYTTNDHPTANGRQPVIGDRQYTLSFTLEDRRILEVNIGEQTYQSLSQMILDMLADTPSYDDGSLG